MSLSLLLIKKLSHMGTPEDVGALTIHVPCIVQRRRVHHRLALRHSFPVGRLYLFAEDDRILVHLLHVFFLWQSIACTYALIVACLEWVAVLKRAVAGRLFLLLLFLIEDNVGAISGDSRVETASLTHCIVPRQIFAQLLAVLIDKFGPDYVLFAFIRIMLVS